jgi:hypothetical protein
MSWMARGVVASRCDCRTQRMRSFLRDEGCCSYVMSKLTGNFNVFLDI